MRVILLDGQGNRKERHISGKVLIDRTIVGPVEHIKVTVPNSRVKRVQRWLSGTLSTVQAWDQKGHVWFEVEDKKRDSVGVLGQQKQGYISVGSVLTNTTRLHIEPNKPRRVSAGR